MNPTLSTPDRGDDEPRHTDRLLRWYRCRLAALAVSATEKEPKITASFVDWYASRPDEFLMWRPWDNYQGSGYSLGYWTVDLETFKRALPRARADVLRGMMPPAPPAIPAGPIDVEAALAVLAAPAARAVMEPLALSVLAPGPGDWTEACNRLRRTRDRIRRKTPRACHCCGEMFVGHQVSAVTCDSCKSAGRRRCRACGELFSSSGRGPRKCEQCRAQSP